jgi:hypothetical protein
MDTSKNFENRLQGNLDKLEEIRNKHPQATHIYLRRIDMDGVVIDIPIKGAEGTIKLHPFWALEGSNIQMDDEVEKLFRQPLSTLKVGVPDDVEVPPKPSKKRRKTHA